ncbi:MAG: hypothetical protein KF723_18870 [Rhizobiaceae bacterium]|nr:hypothetical protein [Rhizobiaceae bacterium]
MRRFLSPLSVAAVLLATVEASAQQAEPQKFPFAGGDLVITENEDLEKVLTFGDKELARNYVVFYDRSVEVAGLQVALFAAGDGGNACGTSTVIVWKPADGDIIADLVGEDCGAPPAAIGTEQIYFVPNPLPGETRVMEAWSPSLGIFVAGSVAFSPQPGTDWIDLDPKLFDNIVDAFDNEAVYKAGQALLGDEMVPVVTGLLVGGGYETSQYDVIYASGCVPHACGSADSFMAIDPHRRKLFFAQLVAATGPKYWPDIKSWPADIAKTMREKLPIQE